MLTAYFYHKITGLPLTDPLVTVSVTLANMNNDTKVLDNAEMTPSSSIPWAFRHPYNLDMEIDYMAYYSCSDDNYGEKTTQYYFPASRSVGGGGGSINISGIQATIRNSYDKISTEFDKKLIEMREEIRNEFNETNSHIDIAKTDVIDTIKAIEIPENVFEEKEAKKLAKTVEKLDKKLTSYIDSEMNEKDELSAIAREFTRLEMEDAKKEKEKEIEHKKMMEEKQKMEEEEDKKIMELIKQEFETQEEQEKEEKRKELEKEIEEIEKEKKEKEKELNSLK